jgi:predicted unusual protein kinase regulating ubiquinone biosynthesis (AarF/ABC1/UbiB family)
MAVREDSFAKRVVRYAKVTTETTKLATKLLGEFYLGIPINRKKHASKLRESLGKIKGPLMKIAQLLATIPDALPPEYMEELAALQMDAPPMGWPFVKRRMATELGKDWQSKFQNFDKVASAAASLGQVHKAISHEGTTLALKLQYPGMDAAVEADIGQFKLILKAFEYYDRVISTAEIFEEVKDRLREELDYERERSNLKIYQHIHKDEANVHIPEVIDELSTGRLLTMSWLEGKRILDYVDAPLDQRNRIATNMFRAWYIPLYHYGVIHGDPHLGNYSVREDESINLLDFGCVRVFPPAFVGGVINLYHALLNDDHDLAVHAYETWGFKKLNKELIDVLNIWANFLYAPLLDDRERTIRQGESTGGIYGRETAIKVHQELRRIGGIAPPREFVFMDRAALGLGSVFMHLNAEINWHKLFNNIINDFNEEKLIKYQKNAIQSVNYNF